ncbi:hypothetical protein KKH23_09225 [Patescibacteria group bacterium]|nr:hypothetical protein [Patescibacteria group bacterium]
MFGTILKFIPISWVIGYLIDFLKSLAQKSETKIDDMAVQAIENLLKAADLSNGTVELPKWFDKFLKSFSIKDVIQGLILWLREQAKKTEYEFDDKLVDILVAILVEKEVITGE